MQYYTEIPDINLLDLLIENYDSISIDWTKTSKKKDEQLGKLKAYRKKIVGGQINVCYKASPKQPNGRLYVEKGLGLQFIKREIRQTITKNYKDYDIKAALPTILVWYAKTNGIICSEVEKILGNYPKYKKYKEDILKAIFGGAIEGLDKLKKEIKAVQNFMVGKYPNRPGVKKSNYPGSLCALLLQEYEAQILEHAEDFLLQEKIPTINMLKIYDGFELPDSLIVDLVKLNEYIFSKTGIPVEFVEKPKTFIDTSKMVSTESKWEIEYREIKEDFEKHVAMVRNPLCYVIKSSKGVIMRVPKNEFLQLYAHLTIGKKQVPFVNYWLKDPNKRVYEDIDFIPPPLVCPEDTFNVWGGFPITRTKLFPYSTDDLEPFFSLVELMSNDFTRGKSYEYLLNWIADIIQNPGRKTGVAIVIKGDQGIGKNTIGLFIKKLLSQENYVETANPKEDIFGAYNQLTANKLVIGMNEAESNVTFANNARIKDLVTESTENVREKYLKSTVMRSFCRLLFFSNSRIVVKVEQNDRRFVIFEASSKMRNNREYFTMVNDWMENDFNVRKLFDYLSKRDITDFNFVAERPMTEAYLETMDACKCIELKFLDDLLHDTNSKTTEIKLINKATSEKIKNDYNLPRPYDMKNLGIFIKSNDIPGFSTYNSGGRGWRINRLQLFDWMVAKGHHKPEVFSFVETEDDSSFETDF